MGEDQVVAALLQRTLCDVQEPSFLGWTAFAKALSNVGGYGNRGPAHLMGQPKLLSIGKRFGESINCQHELMRLLPYHQIPEALRGWSLARHIAGRRSRVYPSRYLTTLEVPMNAFFEHHQDSIKFSYRCFDRILLNGCI